jgi:hypothetical protein
MDAIAPSIAFGIGVVMFFTYQIVRMGIDHENKRLALKHGQGDASRLEQIVTANSAELAKLRERVQVLEKLATDNDRTLASDIERLRHSEVRG